MLPTIQIGNTVVETYPIMCALSYVIAIIVGFVYASAYKIKPWKGAVMGFALFLLSIPLIFLFSWFQTGFNGIGSINGVRAWLYSGFITLPIAKLLKIDYKRHLDFSLVVVLTGQLIGKLACLFAGCCEGIPYDGPGATYNVASDDYLFPVQLCEFLSIFGAMAIVIIISAVDKFKVYGNRYPIGMFIYGSTRIIWEFFRNGDKLFYIGNAGVSELAIHALYISIFSAVWFFLTTPYGVLFRKKLYNFIRKIAKKEELDIPSIVEIKEKIKSDAELSLSISC